MVLYSDYLGNFLLAMPQKTGGGVGGTGGAVVGGWGAQLWGTVTILASENCGGETRYDGITESVTDR